MTPIYNINCPHTALCKNILDEIINIPNTPDFVSIPESKALAGAGATG